MPLRPPAPLSPLGRAALAASASLLALRSPARADLVALVSDATAGPALTRLTRRLAASPSSSAMLSTRTPARFPPPGALPGMHLMPAGTLGREYARFMDSRAFDPNDRPIVHAGLVDRGDEAWVLQRYRDVHDLWHVVCDVPTSLFGEVCLKWFEAVHTGGLVGPVLGAVGGPARLRARERMVLVSEIAPWAVRVGGGCQDLMAVRYEEVMERQVEELREEWRVQTPRGWMADPAVLYKGKKVAGKVRPGD